MTITPIFLLVGEYFKRVSVDVPVISVFNYSLGAEIKIIPIS